MISDISEHQLAYGLSEGIEYRGVACKSVFPFGVNHEQ